ncbi:MAG: hypothetical protein QXJ75_00585 [Candidatus Bathyarchaeia archaeon]
MKERVEEKMHISRVPLKEKIAHAMYRIDTQMTKLQQMSAKLQERDREMFERCIGAKLSKDDTHAAIYANECVEIRKIAKIVISAELALERVLLRLQTVEEVGDLLVQMSPVLGIVKETKGKLAGVVPEVSRELEDINTLLSDTLVETGEVTSRDVIIEATSDEAKKVLEEASSIAEEKIGEKFPELPQQLLAAEKPAEAPIALTEGGGTEYKPAPIPKGQLEEQIYKYIKDCGGEMSVEKCARDLGVSSEDVKNAINRLCEEGKIILQ